MLITFTPMRRDDRLTLHRTGDVLTLNGDSYDFSPLPEGAVLPRDAVDCDWLASDVTRKDGHLHLRLILPHGADAPPETRFPSRSCSRLTDRWPCPRMAQTLVRPRPFPLNRKTTVRKTDFSQMQSLEARQAEENRLALETELATAIAALAASNLQVIREAEGGPVMAHDLRDARVAARAAISRLRADLAALSASAIT